MRAVLADSSSGLAQLFYTHFLLPFADVAQVLVFVAMIATALQRAWSSRTSTGATPSSARWASASPASG